MGAFDGGGQVSLRQLEEADLVLVGDGQESLAGTESQSADGGQGLRRGDTESVLGRGQRVEEHRPTDQATEEQTLGLSHFQAGHFHRDRHPLTHTAYRDIRDMVMLKYQQ